MILKACLNKPMMKILTVHDANHLPIYDIVLSDTFKYLEKYLLELNVADRKICIVTENNVAKHYLDEIINIFLASAKETFFYIFEAGEANKNLNTINGIYEKLITCKFDRKDLLVALGGGVTGDMTGYAAATYLRGIDFIQIPTSLLAQVDSSIGGKTGVDFDSYKNMIGAFYQPQLVYINVSTLATLNNREYYSGMGEIIKHGLIKSREYYDWLKDNTERIKERASNILIDMIYKSCDIKRKVVEQDPREQGERALLNFGHTIGHAIEKLMNFSLLHGECVAIGMIAASYLSLKEKHITEEVFLDIKNTIHCFDLPIKTDYKAANDILEVTKLDKKMAAGKIKFILLKGIGHAIIERGLSDAQLLAGIEYISREE